MKTTILAVLTLALLAEEPPRAARSVHLFYTAPAAIDFYNEVTVGESVAGSYFMACGFRQGYFGIQEFPAGREKRVLFSVWDTTGQTKDENNPNAVAVDRRVEVLSQGDDVTVRRFGGEGTGAQSFFSHGWKNGETYRFLVHATVEGDKTTFAAYFSPAGQKWKHVATFRAITGGQSLERLYSFIEDFRRDGKSPQEVRRARFGNGWVRTAARDWQPLTEAMFTADQTPLDNIDAGVEAGRFYLATGGGTAKHAELRSKIRRDAGGKAPADLPDLVAK